MSDVAVTIVRDRLGSFVFLGRLHAVAVAYKPGKSRVTIEEYEKELQEYHARLVRECEFSDEREKARVAARFSVLRGVRVMLELAGSAVSLTYFTLLVGLDDVIRGFTTSAAEAKRATEMIDAQCGEVTAL